MLYIILTMLLCAAALGEEVWTVPRIKINYMDPNDIDKTPFDSTIEFDLLTTGALSGNNTTTTCSGRWKLQNPSYELQACNDGMTSWRFLNDGKTKFIESNITVGLIRNQPHLTLTSSFHASPAGNSPPNPDGYLMNPGGGPGTGRTYVLNTFISPNLGPIRCAKPSVMPS